MKFHVRQNEIQQALNIIKTSKALGKQDEELFSIIKIESFQENGKNRVRFTSANTIAWSSSTLNDEYFEELFGNDDYKEFFNVEECSTVFVDGHTLINVISGYPDNTIINFDIKKKKKGDDEVSNLVCECSRNNKKEKKKSTFLVKIPSFFQETPPNEKRESITIPAREFVEAVSAVEFASSTDDKQREFWGVFIEIRNGEVCSCATDKLRICWYDKKGLSRDISGECFKLVPIKATLVAALKGIDLKKDMTIECGEKFTILRQNDRWHAIPNIVKSTQSDGSSFDWRTIAKGIHDAMCASIRIPRKTLRECAKLASSAGGEFGVRIHFDTKNKKTSFIVEKIEGGGGISCSHEEEILLEDNQFDGEVDEIIILTIDSISEISSRYNCDQVTFRIKNNDIPIEMLSEKDNFRFITGTVDPPGTGND
ncbi:hypothetical protein M0P65_07230 [Candidatus Gracilibacteria bacterium]|nr:hypothetical protein [Candidatus Gracilibacteria bacterium]